MHPATAAVLLGPMVFAGCASIDLAGPASSEQHAAPALNEWTPRIALVFAQGKSIDQSYAVNVSVWPANRVLCDQPPSPKVSLYVSKNNEPGSLFTGQPAIVQHQSGKVAFPSDEFNDVAASIAADPGAKYNFVAYVRGQPSSNVWLHTGDHPSPGHGPIKPTGYASPEPSAVDTVIQVVFPHDEQGRAAPVKTATRVNVAVDLFQHGTTLSVAPDATFTPTLWAAQGGDRLAALPPGVQKTTYTIDSHGYPRWVFNDVRVEPSQTYHFLSTVGLLGQQGGSFPTVWTYARGSKPAAKPQQPPACIP